CWSRPVLQLKDGGGFDPTALRRFLGRADTFGFESAWALEEILASVSLASPSETMPYAAACTERLRLGCAVFVVAPHQPVHLAKSLASLDQLSQGRIEFGVGTGAGRVRPFSAFEVDPNQGIVARFNEGLRLIKLLWTEPTA